MSIVRRLPILVQQAHRAGHSYRDMARLANVALSTIQRCRSNPGAVSSSVAERVMELCETLTSMRVDGD